MRQGGPRSLEGKRCRRLNSSSSDPSACVRIERSFPHEQLCQRPRSTPARASIRSSPARSHDRGFDLGRLPFSLKILLENLLRREDGVDVTAADIEFLAKWDAKAEPSREIAYMPARVLMQDFTGVPAVVDLGAMRDAIKTLGGDQSV